MGTTCYRGNREYAVNQELRPWGNDQRGFRVIKKKWDGWNRLWFMGECRRPGEEADEATIVTRFIGVLLLRSIPSAGEWCVKCVTDDMGPAEKGAPLSWLSEVTIDRRDGYAYPWYQAVREHHRVRGSGLKLTAGLQVKLRNGMEVTITQVSPLRCQANGMLYRLKRSDIDFRRSGLVEAAA